MIGKLLLANKLASLAGTAAVVTATSAAAVTGNLPVVQAEPVEDVSALVETDTTDGSDTTVTTDGSDTTETTDGSDTTETTDGSDTTDTSDGDELLLDGNGIPILSDGSAYGEVGCDGTHGDYVSSVAQDDDIEGPRGRIVSEAARSSCGKDDDADDSDDVDDSDDESDDSDDSDDEPEVEATETPGNGRQGGGSNRGGNGNGGGRGGR